VELTNKMLEAGMQTFQEMSKLNSWAGVCWLETTKT
jgi:hypothetical protein